jgi:N-acetylglutamate synthase-like GNAT family acetyltransferase
MFKNKRFRVRDVKQVIEDLEMARRAYGRVGKIFLCDGDALCLSNDKLLVILNKIRELFPECERVSVYGSAKDVLRKTPEELKELLLTRLEEGMGRNYVLERNGEIIHHAATYAELDNLAVISGVVTREDWRGKGIGTMAIRKLCHDLLKEGKKPCLFYYTKQAEGFYKKIGFEEGTGWAKLVLRKE